MAVGRETVAGEVDVVADALWTIAVVANAVKAARRVTAKTRGVDGRGGIAGACEGSLDGRRHLVHADDMDDVLGSPGNGGDAVAATVDVNDYAVLGDGIGAGEEVVHVHCIEVALALFLVGDRLVTVDDFVVATIDEFACQSHLADGL